MAKRGRPRKSKLDRFLSSMIPKPTHNGIRVKPKRKKKKGWF